MDKLNEYKRPIELLRADSTKIASHRNCILIGYMRILGLIDSIEFTSMVRVKDIETLELFRRHRKDKRVLNLLKKIEDETNING